MPDEEIPDFARHLFEAGFALQAEGIQDAPDFMIGRTLELYQAEYERRHPEEGRWALVKDEP
jgi:hypothetical protein